MTTASLFVGAGPLHEATVRAHLSQYPSTQVIDAETDPVAAVDLSPPLFTGTHLHVRNLHALTDAQLRAFSERAAGTTTTAEAAKLSAAGRRIAAKHLTISDTTPKKGAETTQALGALAGELGVTLTSETRRALTHRNSPERAASVLRALAAAGLTDPDAELITALSTQERDASVPWTLTAALDRRDATTLRNELDRAEAIPTIAYLAKRAIVACLISEGTDPEHVREALPDITDAALRDGASLARHAQAAQLVGLVSALANADRQARTGFSRESLNTALAAWEQAAARG